MKVTQVLELLQARSTEGQEVMETKLPIFDAFLDGGIRKKELVILGGKTGAGKSYLATQWFAKIAKQGYKCAYFSLEIANEMIVSRILAMHSNLPAPHIMFGMVDKNHIDLLKAQGNMLAYEDFMHFYDDIYSLEEIERMIDITELDFVVIDFIQNVILDAKDTNMKLTEISLRLQRLAKKKDVAILALSQLSNKVAGEEADDLSLEYKGSSAIAMVADLGLFIVPKDKLTLIDQEIDLIVKKNRRGQSDRAFSLLFRFPQGVFYEK